MSSGVAAHRTQARVHVVKNLGGKAEFYFCDKGVCG